ncbi:MAG TPA: hypothetical protein VK504_02725, partial [Vicinamibacterales bacterium]|nr:hypothetical protein [Vicinamibacterales bacterium]
MTVTAVLTAAVAAYVDHRWRRFGHRRDRRDGLDRDTSHRQPGKQPSHHALDRVSFDAERIATEKRLVHI